jgi:hypothetical protein
MIAVRAQLGARSQVPRTATPRTALMPLAYHLSIVAAPICS